jgi:hypothetical protein
MLGYRFAKKGLPLDFKFGAGTTLSPSYIVVELSIGVPINYKPE